MARLTLALASIVASGVTAGSARAEICVVADPTGTPLNIRSQPGGTVTGTLPDGVAVEVVDVVSDDRGRAWAFVREPQAGRILGFVFRRYLDCR